MRWFLIAAMAAVAVWLSLWMIREQRAVAASALRLMVGGGLGNILGRVQRGAVTDFIDFHIGEFIWPTPLSRSGRSRCFC